MMLHLVQVDRLNRELNRVMTQFFLNELNSHEGFLLGDEVVTCYFHVHLDLVMEGLKDVQRDFLMV
jgi:hypothetical protein